MFYVKLIISQCRKKKCCDPFKCDKKTRRCVKSEMLEDTFKKCAAENQSVSFYFFIYCILILKISFGILYNFTVQKKEML